LGLSADGFEATIALTGSALPACEPGDTCHSAAFDTATRACTETALPDGAACTSPCLTGGTCRAGVCTGDAVHCDDGDPCTLDPGHRLHCMECDAGYTFSGPASAIVFGTSTGFCASLQSGAVECENVWLADAGVAAVLATALQDVCLAWSDGGVDCAGVRIP